ncbi:MAG TPA: prolyl oligopeptidase family serine peptidase [Candidatus Acidoferrales bacterium]|nr:prolyl oligopeptidase family serine peptidase [Candidatus Acidoferrales bacterium]
MGGPPATRIQEVVETLHGVELRDPYRWLEDGEGAQVRDWVAAQNSFARGRLDAIAARRRLAERLAESLACGVLELPVRRGRWLFFLRRAPGMNQRALFARDGGGPERVLVDPGPLRPDGTLALDWYTPSPDGELVAVGLSEAGDEDSTLQLVETASSRLLEDRIPYCKWSAVAFQPGNQVFLYTRHPAPGEVPPGEEYYHRHLFRHRIGDDPASDPRLFGEGRAKTEFPGPVTVSADGRWTALTVHAGWDRSAVFLRDGEGAFRPVIEGPEAVTSAWFAGRQLLALTNLDAPNWRLCEIDPSEPDPARWRDLVPESEHVLVDAVLSSEGVYAHHLVGACSRVTPPSGGAVELPAFSTVTAMTADPQHKEVYLTIESFTWPARLLEVGAGGGVVAALEPPAGFDPDRFPVRQVTYRSHDGTPVTMFLVGKERGRGPALLTGYGGFNLPRTPLWAPTLVPFLEAGGLFALPNLRGGGEYGEAWHRAGRFGLKQNVFEDFIAAAEHLVASGLTTRRRLAILGGSNGGLLVGAAMTQRPDLFAAVVCRVPLCDMVRYEGFRVAQLWASEYGSAADPEAFRWLLAYSPYHRVVDGIRYPPTLITTGEEDGRVDPMHARKMAARLQAADPRGLCLLRVEPRAGHGQGKPVSKLVPEETDIWAFLWRSLSMRPR